MKRNEERLEEVLALLEGLSYIRLERIPEIELYMDQVTSFMEEHLKKTKRYPEDKVLTKTMINNYAKNNLLPPPAKKKYSREHILLLLFIYYYKNLLSFNDISQLFQPLTERHFHPQEGKELGEIYETIFELESSQMDQMKADMQERFKIAQGMFSDVDDEEDKEYLQLFAFISQLAFDVYMKTQAIERLIDQLREESVAEKDKKRDKK